MSTQQGPDMEWFVEARLGMFIHWGLYAVPGRHEWVQNYEKTAPEVYEKYMRYFNPDLYDPWHWAEMAKNAGMKYVVLTTKHHEGFSMWDTEFSDYSVMHTPYNKDVVRMFVDACRAHGLRIGFYYSLLDWHHPDFPLDQNHPCWSHPDRDERNKGRDGGQYRRFLHGQVRELLTKYGKIDYFFFDFSYPSEPHGKGRADWGSEELIPLMRQLQPGIIINDRADFPGDVTTPEQFQPTKAVEKEGRPVVWEVNQTLNGGFGYDRDNLNNKSTDLLIRMLIDNVAKDGNLLFNIGPDGRGKIDRPSAEALSGLAEWMALHSRAIHGCGKSSFVESQDVRYTQRGKTLYVHVFAWPFQMLHLRGLANQVAYAQLLNDGSEIPLLYIDPDRPAMGLQMSGLSKDTLTLKLPIQKPQVAIPVVELFLK